MYSDVLCDRLLEYVLSLSKAKVVFVATDRDPMISDIEERFKKKKVLIRFSYDFIADVMWAEICCVAFPNVQW